MPDEKKLSPEQELVRNMGRILRADDARGGDMSHVLLNLGRGCKCDRCLAAKTKPQT